MLTSGASWRYKVWDRRDRAPPHELAMQAEMYDEQGTLQTITTLVEAGADINAIDENGSTALHYAVDKGFDSVLEYLAQNGVVLDAKDNRDRTALDLVSGRRLTGNVDAAPITRELLSRISSR